MSLIIEYYHFDCNLVSILVEVQKFTYKVLFVSTVLTNVETCFVVLAGIIIVHSPCLRHEKTVSIYINIFLLAPFN